MRCALTIAAPVVLAGAVALFFPNLKGVFTLLIAATFAAFVVMINCGVARIAQRDSERDLIELANDRGYHSVPVFFLHEIPRTTEFYAAGRIAYGPNGEPLKFEGATEVVKAAREKGGVALAIVPVQYVGQLTGLKAVKTEVIGDNGVLAIVAVSLP